MPGSEANKVFSHLSPSHSKAATASGGAGGSADVWWTTLLAALALAAVVSTQFLFQPFIWRHWPVGEILLGWLEILRDRVVVAAAIAFAFATVLRLPLSHGPGRALAIGLGIALGAAAGEAGLMLLAVPMAAGDAATLAGRVLRWSSVAVSVAALQNVRMRSARVENDLRRAELAKLEGDTQLANLRLQALRAQIEPHFLFNTLATVRHLGATDPALRARLLDHLHTFTRLSLAAQPGNQVWTLGQELELVRAYLGVVGIRMDGLLAVDFDVDDAGLACDLPPLMLATLVENAVKHGITPSTRGGSIRIEARHDRNGLAVTVADTGVGFRASAGTGIGLANTRARLRTAYGARASLGLRGNHPCGVVALLHLPLAEALH